MKQSCLRTALKRAVYERSFKVGSVALLLLSCFCYLAASFAHGAHYSIEEVVAGQPDAASSDTPRTRRRKDRSAKKTYGHICCFSAAIR